MKVQGLGPEALKDQVHDDNGEDDDIDEKERHGAAFFLQRIRIVIYIIQEPKEQYIFNETIIWLRYQNQENETFLRKWSSDWRGLLFVELDQPVLGFFSQ